MKVVNLGSLNIDYVYRVDAFIRPGETKPARQREIFCGGKGLNQSIACAKAGLDVYHAGFVGKEGHFLVEKMRESGVKTEFVREVDDCCGHAIIQVNDDGQNCILLYPGTNAMLTADFVDEVLDHFEPGDVVLLQNETNMVGQIMVKAVERGLRVAFNAAPFTEAVKSYPIVKTHWLFVNEIEGGALSGETKYSSVAEKLRGMYPETDIVLTLGSEGSIYTGQQGSFHSPAQRVVPVDTTAAGDTFTGFYLMGALNGQKPEQSLDLATMASAVAVTHPGAADSIPSMETVKRLLAQS